ncbi:MAG: hypothetical protein ACI4OJ_02005 [Lachnospiraceae bacterium]
MRQLVATKNTGRTIRAGRERNLPAMGSLALAAVMALTLTLGILLPVTPDVPDKTGDTGRYTQTHAVEQYAAINLGIRMTYFDGNAIPMDGYSQEADFCIPGLSEAEHMIPQGIALWEEENLLLISAYDIRHEDPSVLYLLDATTGELTATLSLEDPDGKPFRGHVGGIAVSAENLYLTSGAGRIGYLPLSSILQAKASFPADAWPEGKEAVVQILGEKDLSDYLGGAATAYVSIRDGILMTGNFYHKSSAFDTPADPDSGTNSLLLGYVLSGKGSKAEWESVLSAKAPSIAVAFPKDIDRIQDSVIAGDRIYVSSSFGRTKESTFLAGTLKETDPIGSQYQNTRCYTVDKNSEERLSAMPMLEGFCLRQRTDDDGNESTEALLITESGSAHYQKADEKNRVNASPTDTVWRLPLETAFP